MTPPEKTTFKKPKLVRVKIHNYKDCNPLVENVQESVSKATNKSPEHTIVEVYKNKPQFSFRCVDYDEILKQVWKLDVSKACHDVDISSRIIKKNAIIFILADFFKSSFNNSIYQSEFPSIFKLANIALTSS